MICRTDLVGVHAHRDAEGAGEAKVGDLDGAALVDKQVLVCEGELGSGVERYRYSGKEFVTINISKKISITVHTYIKIMEHK